jgi:hypothetical protein
VPKRCNWCNNLNPAGQEYCQICKRPLNPEMNVISMKIQESLDEELVKYFQKNPQVLEGFVKQMKMASPH